MRFQVQVEIIDSDKIPKDKNRMILSMTKHFLEQYNDTLFNEIYQKGNTSTKNLSFSLYMPDCRFLMEEIEIPSGLFFATYTFYEMSLGIEFFNAFLNGRNQFFSYKGYQFRLNRVKIMDEQVFKEKQGLFKTMSPIVIREHNHDNTMTHYHSLDEEKGRERFRENLVHQIQEGLRVENPEVQIEVLKNKEVKVKNYGIVVLANLPLLSIRAEPYILDYLYKSGIGSLKSLGFGMVNVVRR